MYFVKTPEFIKWFYPSLIWDIPVTGNTLFITFDDGPDENVTPLALDLLETYNARATFFCVGEKAEKQPGLLNRIKNNGHAIGNHSFNHIKGKKTKSKDYFKNIEEAGLILNTVLFRPPYGSIRNTQIKQLRKDYKIVMWSVLTGDFDPKISREKVLRRSIRYTKKGSIIVFHDNNKFKDKMLYALKGFLQHFSELNYNFNPIIADGL